MGCRCEAARRLAWPAWWFSRQRSWRNSRPRRAESAHGTLASGNIPEAGAFFLQNSHGRLRFNHVHPCLHPIYFAMYPALTSWFRSQAVNIHSSTIGSFSSLAVTIFGRRTLRERAALQVCWPMLKNIRPSMRSPHQSLFCARHSPRFSSRPLTHAVLVTRAAGVQAAAVHALLWPPPRSGAAATRRFSGSRRARTARPEFFSPPAVKGSLRSARVGVLEVVMNVHFCTFSVGLPWAWCPSPGSRST